MNNIRLGAPAPDAPLTQLLLRWADHGRSASYLPVTLCDGAQAAGLPAGSSADTDDAAATAAACGEEDSVHVAKRPKLDGQKAPAQQLASGVDADTRLRGPFKIQSPSRDDTPAQVQGLHSQPFAAPDAHDAQQSHQDSERPPLQTKTHLDSHAHTCGCNKAAEQHPVTPDAFVRQSSARFNPIDHIFQFHQALRQELRQLETDALCVEAAVQLHLRQQSQGVEQAPPHKLGSARWISEPGTASVSPQPAAGTLGTGQAMPLYGPARTPRSVAAAIQALEGRFKFMWGIYR